MGGDSDCKTPRVKVHNSLAPIWIIGWLFTIAYAQLPFWHAVLALIIWPYFLGVALR